MEASYSCPGSVVAVHKKRWFYYNKACLVFQRFVITYVLQVKIDMTV